ncbi:hypothetical protein BDV25DRAFT_149992 [Aspergillus avenaceus]|uniref:Uncharacterized protein n=1 Tax=Aspergillus avenaceus TaxID=36643 RepID=A0A5N6U3E4_ASPAV|nr:hypothetical protein BDV25DRAFT_149992 [Aspergillus avenaceus]
MPFVPTSAELQHPLAQEYQNNAGDLATAGLQEDASRRGRSGSKWGIEEVNAVRAVPLVHLDPTRIIPESYFPGDDNEVFYALVRHIRAATVDDLKEYDPDKFTHNPYLGFFKIPCRAWHNKYV